MTYKSTHNCSRRQFISSSIALGGMILVPTSVYGAEIQKLTGTVFINRIKADNSTRIRPGDNIIVSHGSSLTFALGDDAYKLKGGTVITLDTDDNLIVNGLRLLTGAFLSVFGRGRDRKIIMRNATIGIRGTALYINMEPVSTYFCACYGNTTFTAEGVDHDISATHHNAHIIEFDENGGMSMQATQVLGHTDDELRELEAYVGRKPLFDL